MGGRVSSVVNTNKEFQAVLPFPSQEYDNLQAKPPSSGKKSRSHKSSKTAPAPSDLENRLPLSSGGVASDSDGRGTPVMAEPDQGTTVSTNPTSPLSSSELEVATSSADNVSVSRNLLPLVDAAADRAADEPRPPTLVTTATAATASPFSSTSSPSSSSPVKAIDALDVGSPAAVSTLASPAGREFNFQQTEGQIRRERLADCEFECSQINNHIFVGGMHVAQNWDLIVGNGITHIVNCAAAILPCSFQDVPDMHYLTLNMVDGRQDDIGWFLCKVLQFILKARTKGARVLIHCEKGVSRSCSFVIAYLMYSTGCSWKKAFEQVKERRKVCAPNTAFTCNLIEIGDLLKGDARMSPLLFRCAFHLPHDSQTPILKLCRYTDTRKLVALTTSVLDSRGCFILRVFDKSSAPLLFLWQGSKASAGTAEIALKLSEDFFGVFSKAETVERVKEGSESASFFEYVHNDGTFNAKVSKFSCEDFYDLRPISEQGLENLRQQTLDAQQQEHNRLAQLKPAGQQRESSIKGFDTFADDIIVSPDEDAGAAAGASSSTATGSGLFKKQSSFGSSAARASGGLALLMPKLELPAGKASPHGSGGELGEAMTTTEPGSGPMGDLLSPGACSVPSSGPQSLPTVHSDALQELVTDDESSVNGMSAPSSLSLSLSVSVSNAPQQNVRGADAGAAEHKPSALSLSATTAGATDIADSSTSKSQFSPVGADSSGGVSATKSSVPPVLGLRASGTGSAASSIHDSCAEGSGARAAAAVAVATAGGAATSSGNSSTASLQSKRSINRDSSDGDADSPAPFLGFNSRANSSRRPSLGLSFKGDVPPDGPAPMLKSGHNSFKGGVLSREQSFKTDGAGASPVVPPLLSVCSSKTHSFKDLLDRSSRNSAEPSAMAAVAATSAGSSRRNSSEPSAAAILMAALNSMVETGKENNLNLNLERLNNNPMTIQESGEVTARSDNTSDPGSARNTARKPATVLPTSSAASTTESATGNNAADSGAGAAGVAVATSAKVFDDPPSANRAEYTYDEHGDQVPVMLTKSNSHDRGTLSSIAAAIMGSAIGAAAAGGRVAPALEAAPLVAAATPRSRPTSRGKVAAASGATGGTGAAGEGEGYCAPRNLHENASAAGSACSSSPPGPKDSGTAGSVRPAEHTSSSDAAISAATAAASAAIARTNSRGGKRTIRREVVNAEYGHDSDSDSDHNDVPAKRRAAGNIVVTTTAAHSSNSYSSSSSSSNNSKSAKSSSMPSSSSKDAALPKLNMDAVPAGTQSGGYGGSGGSGPPAPVILSSATARVEGGSRDALHGKNSGDAAAASAGPMSARMAVSENPARLPLVAATASSGTTAAASSSSAVMLTPSNTILHQKPSLGRLPAKSPSPVLEKHPSHVMISRGPTPVEDLSAAAAAATCGGVTSRTPSRTACTSRTPSRTGSAAGHGGLPTGRAAGPVSSPIKQDPKKAPGSPREVVLRKPTLFQAIPAEGGAGSGGNGSGFFWEALGVYDDEDLHDDCLLLLVCPGNDSANFIWVGEQFDFSGEQGGGEYGEALTNPHAEPAARALSIRRWAASVGAGDVTLAGAVGSAGMTSEQSLCEVVT